MLEVLRLCRVRRMPRGHEHVQKVYMPTTSQSRDSHFQEDEQLGDAGHLTLSDGISGPRAARQPHQRQVPTGGTE